MKTMRKQLWTGLAVGLLFSLTACAPPYGQASYGRAPYGPMGRPEGRANGEGSGRSSVPAGGGNLAESRPPGYQNVAEQEGGRAGREDTSTRETSGTAPEDSGSTASDADEDNEDNEDPNTPVEDWIAEEGRTLQAVLKEWAERAGWRLVWQTDREYTLAAGAMFRGRFEDVSSALVRALARAQPAPHATFYTGNRVLIIRTKENENAS